MPLIKYQQKKFDPATLKVISQANQILEDYTAQGYDLTLRQLYYQFVSRGIIPNNDKQYKRLGSIINDARLAGLVDWSHITDRTRNLRSHAHWTSPQSIIDACAKQYMIDKWDRQENYVEVWVEKDALVGVLEVACGALDVPYFSCRGYTSQSEMWAAAMRLIHRSTQGHEVHIIHLGDHDPSGIDMSRDIEDRLNMFKVQGLTVNRIALNMDQIEQYNPPPNPAKLSDSRATSYVERFGDESWELDALEPSVITELINDAVFELRDPDKWEEDLETEEKQKAQLVACSKNWEKVIGSL
jgi:hypothetical protein